MTEFGLILPLAIALAVGLLIGLERGWHERTAKEGTRVAGVRTYGLIGLLGGFAGLLASEARIDLVGYAFVGLALALVAGHAIDAWRGGDVGITSLIAGLLTFVFGAGATLGYMVEAAAAAVVTALILGYKSTLHRWISLLEDTELRATLKLLLISVVVLPILPDRGYGPWQALNPYEIWWMVVLIAGISFCGYFAMRIAGTGKGALLTGFLGGLASSTALTLHFARLARQHPEVRQSLAPGILLACGTVFPRVLVVAGIVHPPIVPVIAVPALAMGAVIYVGAGLQWQPPPDKIDEQDQARLSNPLELGSAAIFGILLAVIMLAAKGLEVTFGGTGLMALAAAAGITDVDAITLTFARMSRTALSTDLAALGIILACATNSLVKAVLTVVIGGRALGLRTALPLGLAAAVGLALVAVTTDPLSPA